MKEAVVFAGRNALDFPELRHALLRIPEVTNRLKQAQNLIDEFDSKGFDCKYFIGADNSVFMKNIKWKSLASAICQVALYDRYRRLFPEPQVLVGNSTQDSAVKVCTNQLSFEELICKSPAVQPAGHLSLVADNVPQTTEPMLSGIALEQFEALEVVEVGKKKIYQRLDVDSHDFQLMTDQLIKEQDVGKFVIVGPGNNLMSPSEMRIKYEDVQLLDSVEMDPMLNWFWRAVRSA